MKKKTTRNKLAENTKKYRIKNGFTQEKIAEVADIEYKYYQSIEGKNPPNITLETLDKLAKALKTSPSELLKDD